MVLPSGSYLIAVITQVYERGQNQAENIFLSNLAAYYFEAKLLAIYDPLLQKVDSGVNSFPIIGSEVFAVTSRLYQELNKRGSVNGLSIGNSFADQSIEITVCPDILFGKHLGIFGNSGSGKSCTVASLLQGLKRRLTVNGEKRSPRHPKIVLFDANGEYKDCFQNDYRIRTIGREDLRLPHTCLSFIEYYRFLNASPGIQGPFLKEALKALGHLEKHFSLLQLLEKIQELAKEKSSGTPGNASNQAFAHNQLLGWLYGMIYRLEQIVSDISLSSIIDSEDQVNTVIDTIFGDDNSEIFIVDADFSRDELDIIVFLFCKHLYSHLISERNNEKNGSLLLIFEEAHRYIHSEESKEFRLGNFYIERLAREGRKFGLSLLLSSQRPSELSQTVLSQCNSLIVHKLVNKDDLDFVTRAIGSSNTEISKIIPGLERQFAVGFGEAFSFPSIFKLMAATPTPNSNDPQVIANWDREFSEQSNNMVVTLSEEYGLTNTSESFPDDDIPF